MDNDIASRLLASDAVASLTAERDIAELLDDLGWNVVHSMFYTDTQTNKRRELDASARSIWTSRSDDGSGAVCAIRLLVEAKTAGGYHIVFAPSRQIDRHYRLPECWMGEEAIIERIVRAIISAGVPVDDVKDFRSELLLLAQGGGVAEVHVVPPKAERHSTSFKETNIGNEKELENSVLWRAMSTVDSALGATFEAEVSVRIEDVLGRVAIDELYGYPPLPHVMDDLKSVLGFRECYHPIVVIDAILWQLGSDGLSPIDWCRFEQRDESHIVHRWVDVVRRPYFSSYAHALTSHYNRSFKKLRARRAPKSAA
jgi:hypothetical protein